MYAKKLPRKKLRQMTAPELLASLMLRQTKYPGTYSLWVGKGKNWPARVFLKNGNWSNLTHLNSISKVKEYLDENQAAYYELVKILL